MAEEWRAVVNYEGLYEVSNLGRVRSLERVILTSHGVLRRYRGCLLRQTTTTGYHLVGLSKEGCETHIFVHRLVAIAFCDKPLNGQIQVNHKNGIKSDNRAMNLEWATRSENMQHAIRSGLFVHPCGEKSYRSRRLYDYRAVSLEAG